MPWGHHDRLRGEGAAALTRRQFVGRIGLGAAGWVLGKYVSGVRAIAQQPLRRPNVILVVADDLGYAGIGVQGCTDIPTPNIDSIAQAGVRFTNGYVSCPVCSPTRAGLMTGRYQQRFGHEFNPGPVDVAGPQVGLPLSERTMADWLKALGYATGLVGKWHLGWEPDFHPMKRGFDEFFGFLGGSHPYTSAGKGRNAILRGTEPVTDMDYTTDAFAREAAAFIERHRAEPFFLYLAFNAVHTPLQATEKYLARFTAIADEKRRVHAAMLSAMDDGVGSVLAKVRELGLEEDTLIFFISDNGGPTAANTSRNDPLRGVKGQLLEGGIRVPFLAQWKGHLPASAVYENPVIALDILPTALGAAGAAVPAGAGLDGVNLLPYLTGEAQGRPHETLFWRQGEHWAVRSGDWKLVRTGRGLELYDLGQDVGEVKNLAAAEPAKVKELQAMYKEWAAQLAEPLWRPNARRRQRGQRRQPTGRRRAPAAG